MRFLPAATVVGLTLGLTISPTASAEPWLSWRGPNGDNHAATDGDPPVDWNIATGRNVLWETPLPGRGHSSPVVTEDAVFLASCDQAAETQSLVRIDRTDGRVVFRRVLHRGTLPARIHPNNTHASSTPAHHDGHLFVAFHTDDAIYLSKVSEAGDVRWQRRVADFRPVRFQFGYGASPVIENDIVIVAAEYDGFDSGLYGLDVATGRQVWRAERPSNLNFASPIVATVGGQRQVLIAGADRMDGYDPATGENLWTVETATEAICGTCVWSGDRVLVSGGNPVSGTWCVDVGDPSRPNIAWENNVKCYEQSLLIAGRQVYGHADSGVLYCWDIDTGRQRWRQRLGRGGVSASPLLVDDRIYAADEAGKLHIVAADPNGFRSIAEVSTADSIFASPVAVDGVLYLRLINGRGGSASESLVAIGPR